MACDILITGERDQEERPRILLQDIDKRIEISNSEIHVTYDAGIRIPILSFINHSLGRQEFRVSLEMRRERTDPVQTIRGYRKLQKGLEMVVDGI